MEWTKEKFENMTMDEAVALTAKDIVGCSPYCKEALDSMELPVSFDTPQGIIMIKDRWLRCYYGGFWDIPDRSKCGECMFRNTNGETVQLAHIKHASPETLFYVEGYYMKKPCKISRKIKFGAGFSFEKCPYFRKDQE